MRRAPRAAPRSAPAPGASSAGRSDGTSLRADLVPRPADGSDWWLRAKVEGLVVEGKQVTLQPGDEVAVGNWGTLSPRPDPAALPAGAPLRWWRAALQLEFTRAHAGYPAGTTFLIGWVAADRAPLAMAAAEPPLAADEHGHHDDHRCGQAARATRTRDAASRHRIGEDAGNDAPPRSEAPRS